MIGNFFKIAWRNIWNAKGYSFLNIFGLALGIACATMIFLWVENELTYDDYFEHKSDLYVVYSKQTYQGHTYSFTATPGPLSDALKADFSEVAASSRSTWGEEKLFTVGDKKIKESGRYVDPDYLKMFSLKFIEGNPETALKDVHNLVISQAMAKRFFGNDPAIGQRISMDNKTAFTVQGVVEDLPENVSASFEWACTL